jgi:hypothetical protein
MGMIEPKVLFFVNAFVFDRGLHRFPGCDERKGTKAIEMQTSNIQHRTSNVERECKKAKLDFRFGKNSTRRQVMGSRVARTQLRSRHHAGGRQLPPATSA